MACVHAWPRLATVFSILSLASCGAETLCATTGFDPTPPAQAWVVGRLAPLPEAMRAELGDQPINLRLVSAEGLALASADVRPAEEFRIALDPGQDQANLRVVAGVGTYLVKTLVPEARAGTEVSVGEIGAAVSAHALLAERNAELERGSLMALPPQTVASILRQAAASDDERVQNFRNMVRDILATSHVGQDAAAIAVVGSEADASALERAGLSVEAYRTLRDQAAAAVAVPVVCDPARVRVLFTCDISGQALDGNGVTQFIRQQPRDEKVFLGITVDPSSPVSDVEGVLRRRLTPNDSRTQMFDDGSHGDEVAGDKVFSLTLDLPRGLRVIYKYTDGAAGEGFTGTQEWPGNARILQIDDVITGTTGGKPDCLVIRRDSFGDEASNKNFVNLNSQLGDGILDFDRDLGGLEAIQGDDAEAPRQGGLSLDDLHSLPPLSPAEVAEARENGVCQRCPAPLTVATDDDQAPRLIAAAFTATDRLRASFSEDLGLASASDPQNYLLLDDQGAAVPILSVAVRGSQVELELGGVSFAKSYRLQVSEVTDASAQANPIAAGSEVLVGPDMSAPSVISVEASTITELNPASRPADPSTGQVLVLSFSEQLDHISAENVDNYHIVSSTGAELPIFAAFQRGKQVLLVTDTQGRGTRYQIDVDGPFDVAGNLMPASQLEFLGLALYRVRFQAVVGFAYLSEDGSERGLPPGEQLYLTGTVTQYARAADGRDLRVSGRTDIAGLDGYAFTPSQDQVSGQDVQRLDLFLPAGTYAWKLAHGRSTDVVDPPSTLEAVSKSLATTNDDSGVLVNPITMIGRDGQSYAGARLSETGLDSPGPSVLFKRENPDERLVLGAANLSLEPVVIGAWRDLPFGEGSDYDDGRLDLPHWQPTIADQQGPVLRLAVAPCSAGILLSFDEVVANSPDEIEVEVNDSDGNTLSSAVQYVGAPLRSTQIFVQTAEQFPQATYIVSVANVDDSSGNTSTAQTANFVAPGVATACQVVDDVAPALVELTATRPTQLRLRFSEQIHSSSVVPENFVISHRQGGTAPQVLSAILAGGGAEVLLETERQEIGAPYTLAISDIADLAQPPNVLAQDSLDFSGFGEHDPPTFQARAVTPTLVMLRFNEPVTAETAMQASHYSIPGLTLGAVEFSASPSLIAAAVSAAAPIAEDLVLLHTSPQQAGQSYSVAVNGVADLSGNLSASSADFNGLAEAPLVDLRIEYLVSRSATVLGAGPAGSSGVPGRAISVETLNSEREGVFIRGEALSEDGTSAIAGHPVTVALGGFPARGDEGLQDFAGPDPQLVDDASGGDRVAGDGVYSMLIRDVPLGSVVAFKAFASYSTAYRDSSGDPAALMADADPGPSQYDDGEEYPGNDNGARILADSDGDGVVVLRNLFGDEVSYKRREDGPIFVWVDDVYARVP